MNAKRIGRRLAALAFWLAVWEVCAVSIDLPFAIPTIGSTIQALGSLIVTQGFWMTIAASLLRIMLGLLMGVLIGAVLAGLSVASQWARAVVSPAMTVIRCTPVASFIMILWILAGRDSVPGIIAILMVAPVIWQSLLDGYAGLDHALDELLRVFHATVPQRVRLLVLPGLKASFMTGIATSAGLAWKAGIAAEIIAYTTGSIGRQIADARNMLDGPQMMAWTLCVVVLSLLLEKAIRAVSAYFS